MLSRRSGLSHFCLRESIEMQNALTLKHRQPAYAGIENADGGRNPGCGKGGLLHGDVSGPWRGKALSLVLFMRPRPPEYMFGRCLGLVKAFAYKGWVAMSRVIRERWAECRVVWQRGFRRRLQCVWRL